MIRKWLNGFRWWRRCQACGHRGAMHYHQRTQYVNERQNWVTLCRECKEMNDEYWDERWAEYYGGLL